MTQGEQALDPGDQLPEDIFRASVANIADLQDQLEARIIGDDALAQIEQWDEIGDAMCDGMTEQEYQKLKEIDRQTGGKPHHDGPKVTKARTGLMLQGLVAKNIPPISGLEDMLPNPLEVQGGIEFIGPVARPDRYIDDGAVSFLAPKFDGTGGSLGIVVQYSERGAREDNFILAIFGHDDEERKQVETENILDSPFNTDELLTYVANWEDYYKGLLELPKSQLLRWIEAAGYKA